MSSPYSFQSTHVSGRSAAGFIRDFTEVHASEGAEIVFNFDRRGRAVLQVTLRDEVFADLFVRSVLNGNLRKYRHFFPGPLITKLL